MLRILRRAFGLATVLLTAGCATSSLDLAPATPGTPFVPPGAPAPIEMSEVDFGLPARPALAVVQPPPATDPVRVHTLPELIDIAQTTNPTTRIAWEQARQAALAVGIVKASYLPVVTATVLGGYQYTSSSQTLPLTGRTGNLGTEATGTVSTAALQWLLFDFGQRDALAKAAGKLSLASNISFNAVHQKIIYDVGRQFYEFGAARERVRIAGASQRDARAVLDAAESRLHQGVGTTVEVAQAKQMLAQADFDLVQGRNAERDSYNGLIGAMGVSPVTRIRVEDASVHPLPPLVGAPPGNARRNGPAPQAGPAGRGRDRTGQPRRRRRGGSRLPAEGLHVGLGELRERPAERDVVAHRGERRELRPWHVARKQQRHRARRRFRADLRRRRAGRAPRRGEVPDRAGRGHVHPPTAGRGAGSGRVGRRAEERARRVPRRYHARGSVRGQLRRDPVCLSQRRGDDHGGAGGAEGSLGGPECAGPGPWHGADRRRHAGFRHG